MAGLKTSRACDSVALLRVKLEKREIQEVVYRSKTSSAAVRALNERKKRV